MRNWFPFSSFYLLALTIVYAANDGPVDWNKAPGGGPPVLRACARTAYGARYGTAAVNGALGCDLISCACRTDLVNAAHEYIRDTVKTYCGPNEVDINSALKLYDDFCSSNGYLIPGYTYVSTQTVRVSSTTQVEVESFSTDASTLTTSGNTRSPTVTAADISGSSAVTVTAIRSVTVTAGGGSVPTSPSATVTLFRSQATRRIQPWPWFGLISILLSSPKKRILALADSLVVTYTSFGPEPGKSVVVTSVEVIPTTPAVVVHTEFLVDSQNTPYSTTKYTVTSPVNSNSGSTSTKSSSNTASPGIETVALTEKGKGSDLSKLEIVGIILGIIAGLITTVATVWMCLRGSHRLVAQEPARVA